MYLVISSVSSKLWQLLGIRPKVLEALGPHLSVNNILTSLAIERLHHAIIIMERILSCNLVYLW